MIRDGRDDLDGRDGQDRVAEFLTVSTVQIIPTVPTCQRCGFPVPRRLQGCKNPCPNCHTVYPLGDCSD